MKTILRGGVEYPVPPNISPAREILFLRSLEDYMFIADQITAVYSQARILEVGCGYGYGAYLLSKRGHEVFAIDADARRIKYAEKIYATNNPSFSQGDAAALTDRILPGSFDVVVAMQLIEHLPDPNGFIQQAKQITSNNGMIILSTPNGALRVAMGQKPWNHEHYREYDKFSLTGILYKYFPLDDFACYSLKCSPSAQALNEALTGGDIPPRLKTLWRYTPEFIRKGVRKIIDANVPTYVTLDDYEMHEGLHEDASVFFAFCKEKKKQKCG